MIHKLACELTLKPVSELISELDLQPSNQLCAE